MIYLITDGKYLKIGYSENISNRMKSYSTHSNNFKLLSYKEGGTKDESILHEKYEKLMLFFIFSLFFFNSNTSW